TGCMPEDHDNRLAILERAQETLERTLRLHTDVLASQADAHREHRARMAKLEDNHQVLLDLLAASEQRLEQQRQMLANHAEHIQARRAAPGHQRLAGAWQRTLDVHFASPAPVPSLWERRAPARLLKPRWSVAIPGEPLENWRCISETDI